ncbi:hemolysin family protein [Corynebacterium bovis]|uniref:hemolysin family protein n=1 Tax=Corynebacterium bovis TaxID=36808 RepID=UPI0031389208
MTGSPAASVLWTVVGIVVLLPLAGVLSSVETAVASLSRARVETMVDDERPGAPRLLAVLGRRAEHINLLVLLRTVSEVAASVLAASLAVRVFGTSGGSLVLVIALVALFTYVVVGVISRTLGRQNPYTLSLRAAPVLAAVGVVLGPVAKVLVWFGTLITPGRGFRDGPFASEIELREMVDIASERGIVENDERRMIQSVFDLASTTARSVMVPRPEMLWIEDTKSAGQATSLCVRSGHSRLPVIGESVDDIVGVVYLKDLVARTYSSRDSGRSVPVTDVMRDPVFVPDSRKLDDLLEDMQRDHIHIAMLVDEYGGIAGLISIEDILEEIVGEIADEYDDSEQAPVEDLGDGRYRVVARFGLDELEELFADRGVSFTDEQHEDVETVAGLAAFELGRVPLPGAEVEVAGLHLHCEGGRDRRGRLKIRSVVVTGPAGPVADDDERTDHGR